MLTWQPTQSMMVACQQTSCVHIAMLKDKTTSMYMYTCTCMCMYTCTCTCKYMYTVERGYTLFRTSNVLVL